MNQNSSLATFLAAWQPLYNSHHVAKSIQYFMNHSQRRIQNTIKHLRRSVLKKQVTAFRR